MDTSPTSHPSPPLEPAADNGTWFAVARWAGNVPADQLAALTDKVVAGIDAADIPPGVTVQLTAVGSDTADDRTSAELVITAESFPAANHAVAVVIAHLQMGDVVGHEVYDATERRRRVEAGRMPAIVGAAEAAQILGAPRARSRR